MANQKARSERKTSGTRSTIGDLEKRLEALERRVAILEAKQSQPTLAERIAETNLAERRIGLDQEQ